MIYLIMFLWWGLLFASSADQVQGFIGNIKSAVQGVSSALPAIGVEQFGAVPGPEHQLNYLVYNDTAVPVFVGYRYVTTVMGVRMWNDLKSELTMMVSPYGNSGIFFSNLQQRFSMVLSYISGKNSTTYKTFIDDKTRASRPWSEYALIARDEFGLDPDTTAPGYHDPYVLRAYTKQGVVAGEYLSQRPTTTQFIGSFYNNTGQSVTLTFAKGEKTYTVRLDPGSMNTLTSGNGASIRSESGKIKFFTCGFPNAALQIPVSETGLFGSSYVYEMYNGTVGIQGLALGNFDIVPLFNGNPDPTRIRDINPVPVVIWPKVGDFKEPYTMWFAYKTVDQTLYTPIKQGIATYISLLRPSLAEKQASFYVVLMKTDDALQVKLFLERLCTGKIAVTMAGTSSSLSTLVPNTQSLIDDRTSGASGYVLLADVLLPSGMGSAPCYYSIESPTLMIDLLVSLVAAYVQDLDEQDLKKQIPQWIDEYKRTKTVTGLRMYLQNKGTSDIVDARKMLNERGLAVLDRLVNGSVGIAQYPILRFAGTSHFTSAPEGIDTVPREVL